MSIMVDPEGSPERTTTNLDNDNNELGKRMNPFDEEIVQEPITPSSHHIPFEIFRYRVIYPGGTYLRISPNINAEKAGEVLECGTIIRSSKSLVLDGVNYVFLSNPTGWIFVSKNGVQVLELIECIRIANIDSESWYSLDHNEKRTVSKAQQERKKLFDVIREESKYWRTVRAYCGHLTTFDELLALSLGLEKRPPPTPDPGPARAAWLDTALYEQDKRVRACISRITAITRQSAEAVSVEGLEACLWLLTHLGSKVAHAVALVAEAANRRFESVGDKRSRAALLSTVLDVAARSRPVVVELVQMEGMDLLPDDIRNFLQRWVIIMYKDFKNTGPSSEDEDQSSPNNPLSTPITTMTMTTPVKNSSVHSECRGNDNDNDNDDYAHGGSSLASTSTPRKTPSTTLPLPSDIFGIAACMCRPGHTPTPTTGEGSGGIGGGPSPSRSWIGALTERMSSPRTPNDKYHLSNSTATATSNFWKEVEREMRKISDPTVQYARLI